MGVEEWNTTWSVRSLGVGLQIRRHKDMEQCTCVDGKPDVCWDIDNAVNEDVEDLVAQLGHMETELRQLLAQMVANRTRLRPSWRFAWSRFVQPGTPPG